MSNPSNFTDFEFPADTNKQSDPFTFDTLKAHLAQMGVGGDNSWGATQHPEFMLPANKAYRYALVLRPFKGDAEDAARLARRAFATK